MTPSREIQGLADARAFATRVHGSEAAAALSNAPAVVGATSVQVAGTAPCQWLSTVRMGVPVSRRAPLSFDAERGWMEVADGLGFWSRVVTTPDVDLLQEAHRRAAFEAIRALAFIEVMTTPAQVEALVAPPTPDQLQWRGVPQPADASVVSLFEPPHFEGRRLVFHGNLPATSTPPYGSAFTRVTLDVDTGAVHTERLARGRQPGYPFALKGRAYIDDDGRPCVAAHGGEARGARAAWTQAMLAEHASVASFSRASLELMAVAAPLDLVRRTHEAALDEIRHTRLSLDVLARLGASAPGPGPLPALRPRPSTIADVATTTLLDAAVNETLAAESARVAAARCMDPFVARVLEEIAADEARHARLAWDIVAWACAVDDAARAAVRALAAELVPPSSSGSVSDDDACGQLTAATELEVWRSAFEGQVRACLTALTIREDP